MTLTGPGTLIVPRRSLRCRIAPFECTCHQARSQLVAPLRLVERRREKRDEFAIVQLLERVGQILGQHIPVEGIIGGLSAAAFGEPWLAGAGKASRVAAENRSGVGG